MKRAQEKPETPQTWPTAMPAWARANARNPQDADAAFAAGIALKSIDDLVRANPAWAGAWRARQALKCAAAAARARGRTEDEPAIRDAIALTATGDDPGPEGRVCEL